MNGLLPFDAATHTIRTRGALRAKLRCICRGSPCFVARILEASISSLRASRQRERLEAGNRVLVYDATDGDLAPWQRGEPPICRLPGNSTYAYLHIYVYVHTYTYICTYVYTYIYIYACMSMSICMCAFSMRRFALRISRNEGLALAGSSPTRACIFGALPCILCLSLVAP